MAPVTAHLPGHLTFSFASAWPECRRVRSASKPQRPGEQLLLLLLLLLFLTLQHIRNKCSANDRLYCVQMGGFAGN